jgi:glycosyltransferase involved in cell wall biosynthesis
VVDFAVEPAVRCWDRLARMGCKLIHVGCHNVLLHHENVVFRHRPPTAVVFQSRFQQSCLGLQYAQWGVPEERQAMIHGAFDVAAFPFSMLLREDRAPLVIGRLARAEPFKYPPTMWDAMAGLRKQVPQIVARCMGWKPVCGVAPAWAECLPEGTETSREFLSKCHALICTNLRGTTENWSRVVLEAMSCGVPVIADNRGGYREQIVNGQTGFLVDTPQQATAALAKLAMDESLRERIARHAHQAVKKLASPETIGAAWQQLFQSLA